LGQTFKKKEVGSLAFSSNGAAFDEQEKKQGFQTGFWTKAL